MSVEGARALEFQYRKRYEVTCDIATFEIAEAIVQFQYRKRYEVTCDEKKKERPAPACSCFNTASGMRSHATHRAGDAAAAAGAGFNTASGMRSHATLCLGGRRNRKLKSRFLKTSSKPNV